MFCVIFSVWYVICHGMCYHRQTCPQCCSTWSSRIKSYFYALTGMSGVNYFVQCPFLYLFIIICNPSLITTMTIYLVAFSMPIELSRMSYSFLQNPTSGCRSSMLLYVPPISLSFIIAKSTSVNGTSPLEEPLSVLSRLSILIKCILMDLFMRSNAWRDGPETV